MGVRMRRCLEELLGSGYARALVVGSDAPTLGRGQISEALGALVEFDAVLGPAEDGGFTLIGARRTDPGMFRGVAWSRDDTCSATLRALRAAGLSAATTVTVGCDIDRPADLERLRRDPALPQRLDRWFRQCRAAPL